jgi:hypothetical protein
MTSPRHRYDYRIEISRASDGRRFGLRQVPDAHLEPAREQLTFLAQRRGKVPANASGLETLEFPRFEDEKTGEIEDLALAVGHDADRVETKFGLSLFQPFAQTVTAELIQSKQLEAGEEVVCRTYAQQVNGSGAEGSIVASVKRRPLPLVEGSLDAFLEHAVPVGDLIDGDYPVFVLDEVLSRGQELSWKGRSLEGGAWLVGGLYQQWSPSPEIFGVVHTVLEARGASHERFSIDLSSETFLDFKAQLSRRKRFGRVAEVEFGFYHSHPFLPSILDGKEACPTCPLRPECNLSSSFFSQTDASFHKALFTYAPYAVEFVLGLSPREEFDLRMFTMQGNSFRQRGYYRLAAMPQLVTQPQLV